MSNSEDLPDLSGISDEFAVHVLSVAGLDLEQTAELLDLLRKREHFQNKIAKLDRRIDTMITNSIRSSWNIPEGDAYWEHPMGKASAMRSYYEGLLQETEEKLEPFAGFASMGTGVNHSDYRYLNQTVGSGMDHLSQAYRNALSTTYGGIETTVNPVEFVFVGVVSGLASRAAAMAMRSAASNGGFKTASIASTKGTWKSLGKGVRIKSVGSGDTPSYWIKTVDPNASKFWQWWGRIGLDKQASGLTKLGNLAPKFVYRNGKLVLPHVEKYSGTRLHAWYTSLQTKIRLRTPFDDAHIGNIGANGIVFDPSVHPVMEYGVWWPIAFGGGFWLGTEISGDD